MEILSEIESTSDDVQVKSSEVNVSKILTRERAVVGLYSEEEVVRYVVTSSKSVPSSEQLVGLLRLLVVVEETAFVLEAPDALAALADRIDFRISLRFLEARESTAVETLSRPESADSAAALLAVLVAMAVAALVISA